MKISPKKLCLLVSLALVVLKNYRDCRFGGPNRLKLESTIPSRLHDSGAHGFIIVVKIHTSVNTVI
jgi:hypothetical protein